MIVVQTTKEIKKNESLWAHYGPNYQAVLDQIHTIHDEKQKMKQRQQRLLDGIDLNADVPIDLSLIERYL